MANSVLRISAALLACLSLNVLASGCGGDSTAPNGAQNGAAAGDLAAATGSAASPAPGGLPTASISNQSPPPEPADDGKVVITELKPGSPEWLIREIMKVRIRPLPQTDDVNELREAQRTRNLEVVELATKVLVLTHQDALADPQKERVFNVGVHQLMDARLQLALQGEQESIDALYEHSDSLRQRAPGSEAAMDAAYAVARFAHANAQRFAAQEPRWLQEFARQARLFAVNFPQPQYQNKALSLLFAAGQSCDLNGFPEDAISCFSDIRDKYPESPQSKQVVSYLRRLNLHGNPLQLAGPSIDGGFVNIDDYRGKVVLVVFWSTDAPNFRDQLATLMSVGDRYKKYGFETIGVNLNENEPDVDAFLEQHALTWSQIFYADPDRRGWNNPIAVYYGVRSVPSVWLVGADGKVVNANVDPRKLEAEVRQLLQPAGQSGKRSAD